MKKKIWRQKLTKQSANAENKSLLTKERERE